MGDQLRGISCGGSAAGDQLQGISCRDQLRGISYAGLTAGDQLRGISCGGSAAGDQLQGISCGGLAAILKNLGKQIMYQGTIQKVKVIGQGHRKQKLGITLGHTS